MSLKNSLDFTDAESYFDEPMKNHTSFGVGGRADCYAKVKSLYGLNDVITKCKSARVPYKIIGNGTNILVSDKGFRGVIISTEKLNDVFFKLDEVKAMCGAPLMKLINFAAENNLSGLYTLCGIPATVGGGVVMNAGAFGGSVSDYLTTVETVKDGKLIRYDKEQCDFGYRKSRFLGKNEPVVSATFKLPKRDGKQILEDMKRVISVRRKLHPFGKTFGSTFKNPSEISAGQLIDSAGLKDFSIGGARISEKHANFIINVGNATATDVYTIIDYVKTKIKTLFGVTLTEEVEYIGEF